MMSLPLNYPFYSPLVGREAELSQIQHRVGLLGNHQGGLMALIGELGVGKSRLIQEAQSFLRGQKPELYWLTCHATETDKSFRYCSIQALLFNAIGIKGQGEALLAESLLRNHLDEIEAAQSRKLYPVLAKLLDLTLTEAERDYLAWLDEAELKQKIHLAIKEWLSALASKNSLALVIEDIQWIDHASAEVLESLLPLTRQLPLLILVSMRPEPGHFAWQLRDSFTRNYRDEYMEIWLKPLAPSVVKIMVENLLGAGQVSPRAIELIASRSDGNPLFIEEIVRAMLESETLMRDVDSVWRLAQGWETISIPTTLQGVLSSRINRLEVNARKVLSLAACIGRQFPARAIFGVTATINLSSNRLNRSIKSLEADGLIQSHESGQGYWFKHALIHDTTYHNLSQATRKQYHSAIARWLEANALIEPAPSAALIAHHYEQAENIEKQREFYSKAGFQAAQRYDNLEGRAYITKALSLTDESSQRFELLLERERLCGLGGERAQQRADLDELVQIVNAYTDYRKRAVVYNRLANWHESMGEYETALCAYEDALVASQRGEDLDTEAESLHRMASANWRQGNFSEAIEAAQAALGVSLKAGNLHQEAASLTTLGVVHRTLGNLELARNYYQRALSIQQSLGDRREIAISLAQLGNVHYDLGEYSQAHDDHLKALEIFQQVGDRRGEAWSLGGIGTIFLHCGSLNVAQDYYQKALELRRAVGDRRGEGVALGDVGNAEAAIGNLEQALVHIRASIEILGEIGARRDEGFSLTYLGLALEQAGRLGEACETHQTALALKTELGQQNVTVENLAGLARIALQQGEPEQACRYNEELLSWYRKQGTHASESPFRLYITMVRVLRSCGNVDVAQQILGEARQAVLRRAELINDPELRNSFLTQVPETREILAGIP